MCTERLGCGIACPTLSTQGTTPPEESDECSGEYGSQHDAAHHTGDRHKRVTERTYFSS
jgi:hypothetical protein